MLKKKGLGIDIRLFGKLFWYPLLEVDLYLIFFDKYYKAIWVSFTSCPIVIDSFAPPVCTVFIEAFLYLEAC